MPKTVYLCRHGQAEHNVTDDWSIPDPPLTAAGRQQCRRLAADAQAGAAGARVELIATSPLKRTLQTTLLGWPQAIARLGGPGTLMVLPQLQECEAHPCDTGSPASVLASDPELAGLNLSTLVPGWDSKQGAYAPTTSALEARAAWVRAWIKSRPEQTILLVAHIHFLQILTDSPEQWANTEVQEWSLDAHAPSRAPPLRFVRSIAPSSTSVRAPSGGLSDPLGGASVPDSDTGGGGLLPELGSTGFDIELDLDSAVERSVAELEGELHTRQAGLEAQAQELHDLDARLAAMEARAKQLEAKGQA